MDRIKKLCSYLDKCSTFADVGCDHGYCTQYMLKNGLCEIAVISDISAKCLQKAENLLADYIQNGKVTSVCCNGLEGISEETEQILIAGMGGEEIVSIFKNSFIPQKFVLQPMKNIRAVREYLLQNGAEISVDEPFESCGKFYFVIKGKKCGNSSIYGGQQLEFGLNLSCETTKKYIKSELNKKRAYLERDLKIETRLQIEEEIRFMEGVLNES
ncbi:MAG: class I SAM-dependent methyltransferase [Clostridia bacterium]|nr:class I SAM-dependent methyltransferase [Clostridia bacterium]